MPKTYKLRIEDLDGSNEEVAELVLEDNEWEVLQDFARYAEELQESSLVKEGIPASLSETWTESEGLKVEAKIPSDEQIDAMLMKLRPFLLKNEPTNFYRVRSLLAKATKNQKVRKHLDTLSYLYSGRHLQSIFVAGASSPTYPEGVIINSEEMLDHWLYGYRFHKEKERRRIFEAMHGLVPPESSIAIFLFMVTDKVKAILALHYFVTFLSGEHEKIKIDFYLGDPIIYRVFLHASLAAIHWNEVERESPLPEEGVTFVRVFDLSNQDGAPLNTPQFVDLVASMWMRGDLVVDVGERYYFFRMAKGFTTPDGKNSPTEVDIIAALKVLALLTEDPFSIARRKPAQITKEMMRRQREGATRSRVLLKAFETREELESFLQGDPKPEVRWRVVPRIAFRFAYWPISRQANERFNKIRREGREPTFEEVEGTDIATAWEIFEQNEDEP